MRYDILRMHEDEVCGELTPADYEKSSALPALLRWEVSPFLSDAMSHLVKNMQKFYASSINWHVRQKKFIYSYYLSF